MSTKGNRGWWASRAGREVSAKARQIIKTKYEWRTEVAVSKDRVEFTPKLSTADNGATNAALVEALGFTRDQAESAIHSETTIRCRPSQFARFIIARERKAGCNGIKNLNARLIIVEEEKPKFIDASRSPNTMKADSVNE